MMRDSVVCGQATFEIVGPEAAIDESTGLAPGHPVNPGHVGRIQLEPLDVTVGLEAIELRRLGNHDDPMLDVPPDHDLRLCHAVSVRDLDERGVPE